MTILRRPTQVSTPIRVVCDKCGKGADFRGGFNDMIEAQDFLSFNDTGGYGSVHGDGTRWSIDLCAPCTIEVLGPYINKESD